MQESLEWIVLRFGDIVTQLSSMIVVQGVTLLAVLVAVILIAFLIGFIFRR